MHLVRQVELLYFQNQFEPLLSHHLEGMEYLRSQEDYLENQIF
jgi:hypothetical protein